MKNKEYFTMKNKNDSIWGLALIVMGITGLILSIANIAGIHLS